MTISRITDLAVRNLEWVFMPAGLPLVAKTGDGAGTTSVSVRGGAGCGKTTLALALAQAIARHAGGAALYLTTEFAPTELVVKCQIHGLGEQAVLPWSERSKAQAGSILVAHLAVVAPQAERVTSTDRQAGAIDAVWSLIDGDGPGSSAAIKVAVIDAFNLPDAGRPEEALRHDLLSFIQALEARGVSTVLVEESGPGSAEWLSFVVDVVFELAFAADPATGAWQRQLTCRKSRYAPAVPGPHGYGLDHERRPELWPDLLSVIGSVKPSLALPPERWARMMIPLAGGRSYTLATGGFLVVNWYDKVGRAFTRAFVSTPGITDVMARCGPLTRVGVDDEAVAVFDGDGPSAIAAALLPLLSRHRANAVVLERAEFLLARPSQAFAALHAIEALRELGYLVLVHGHSEGLRAAADLADLVVDGTYRSERRVPPLPFRAVVGWLPDANALFVPPGEPPPDAQRNLHGGLRQALSEAELALARGATEEARKHVAAEADRLRGDTFAHGQYAAFLPLWCRLSVARYRLGWQEELPWFAEPKGVPAERKACLAWMKALIGRDMEAARACLDAFEAGPAVAPSGLGSGSHDALPARDVLWAALNALYGENDTCLRVLEAQHGTPFEPAALWFRLRALVRRGRAEEADRVAAEFERMSGGVPEYLVARLQAESRLDAPGPVAHAQARDRLLRLLDDASVPALHRADVSYNLGVAEDLLGDAKGAARHFALALDLNPELEIAKRALAPEQGAAREPGDELPAGPAPESS
ncbi:MAG: hypothetical protein HY744_28775 [Deltaproteobacteria bacterium]|nr:hypothetical protein [Deltaproteobacteria bacterium]